MDNRPPPTAPVYGQVTDSGYVGPLDVKQENNFYNTIPDSAVGVDNPAMSHGGGGYEVKQIFFIFKIVIKYTRQS